jgi:hypothetical protein
VGAWIRPDGRGFVRDPEAAALVGALGELFAAVDEADAGRLCAFEQAGFVRHRRELELLIPTDPALTSQSPARRDALARRGGVRGPPRARPAGGLDDGGRGEFGLPTFLDGIGGRRVGASLELIRPAVSR